jgi:hypothetical protein
VPGLKPRPTSEAKAKTKAKYRDSFPFGFAQGQNDDVKRTPVTATTKATAATTTKADPYGMTNKKGNCNGKSNSKNFCKC